MKKVFKFVKGKKDERKESGGISSSQSVDFVSPAQTPEDERFLGLDSTSGYFVDFCGKDKTLTKLHKAAWQGNLEKLKSALKKVDIDVVDRHNRTALHFAVAQGHPNIVWFLLGNNAKTSICDDEGHTPLLKAVECGHKECMTLLLERGADVNVADYTGNTGLHVAISQASVDTASALLKKGAETEVSNNAGDYPLHIATKLENKDLVDLLLQAGACVDVLDRENRTPLMLAAKTGNCVLAQMFVEHGAQLSVVDSNGWTAQDYAMLGGHESVAASLKSFLKVDEKKIEKKREESDLASNGNSESWEDSQSETCEKEPITQKFKKFFEKCSKEEKKDSKPAEREKNDELSESPDAESIPPYCQPPRSWEMIQAGMIDENKNGYEPKRRSITTLGTLHSRRKSFTEGSVSSPQFTLSLNRRKGAKGDNAFAKQRFSFNEEESLRYWINEEKAIRKDLEKIELENMLNLEEMAPDTRKRHSASESDWDSMSVEDSQDSKRTIQPSWAETDSVESHKSESKNSESGTFGREGTMHEIEEIWVANPQLTAVQRKEENQSNSWDSEDPSLEKEGSFPPPPTALELGVDMAKSIKYMKGVSMDQPLGCSVDRNLWKNVYESNSWDCLEEREFRRGISKETSIKGQGKHQSASARKSEGVLKFQKPRDRFTDISKRINEQLECYDQALRELAETCRNDDVSSHNYHSLPSAKTGNGGECRRSSSQELTTNAPSLLVESGSHSLPLCTKQWGTETNERLKSEAPTERSAEAPPAEKSEEKLGKKTKRHILLAMRDVKHAVHVSSTFSSSTDCQILSPLTKPEEDNFDLDEKPSPKGVSGDSDDNSPPDENPFFGIGRQETVLERSETGKKSSSSGTGEEPTLWLQDGVQKKEALCPDSDDDVSDIAVDEKSTHKRHSSFSPLGVIQREMEEENQRNKTSGLVPSNPNVLEQSSQEKFLGGESEEQNEETYRDPSPDISLSSGPIEPIGAEKDSGSEPESSHCDGSPAQNYALKSQHEWLKCHLKVATSEKNKLEELTAQLAEKAERLQYELADAKEAAKSRDEVIQLLQDQLARMETAYTKSLEESVQSRLQLTSHEQEILHLKELCYRYEEEKDTPVTGVGDDFLQELQFKIKILEEEKEKMRKEIIHLEKEKSALEKQLKQEKNEESEMLDQCQRWKERCGQLEEMAKVYDSKQAAYESYVEEKDREYLEEEKKLKQQNFQLEKKFLEMNEENIELKAKIRSLIAEQEAEKRKASGRNENCESISEIKKKNCEMVTHLKDLEKKMEERMVDKLKEKEREIGDLLKQFNRERESLIASYEKKLLENRSEMVLLDVDRWKNENQQLKQTVKNLQDQIDQMQMNPPVENARGTLQTEFRQLKKDETKSVGDTQFNALAVDNIKLRGEISQMEEKVGKEVEEGERRSQILAEENAEVKSDVLELKSQVNSLRLMLDDERWPSMDARSQRLFEKRLSEKSEGKRKGVGKEDELAWSSLYGMKASRRRRGERSTSVTEALMKDCSVEKTSEEGIFQGGKLKFQNGRDIFHQLRPAEELETEMSQKFQKLEFFRLEKEISSLQSKMSDEKNLRQALENQMIKMNLDLSEKENLEKDINSLKRKVDRDCLRRSEIELLEYQKDLEAKREKYLGGGEGREGNNDFKTKCKILAGEREKFKALRNSFGRRAKSLECPPLETSIQHRFNSPPCPRPHPEFFVQSRFVALDPDLKNKLEQELDKSIRKYVLDSSSAQSVPNAQIELVKKSYL